MDKLPQGKTMLMGAFSIRPYTQLPKEHNYTILLTYLLLHGLQVSFKDHKSTFKD